VVRLQFQTGQFAALLNDYKKVQQQLAEEMRPEVMLFAANSQRQLGHAKEAEALYAEIIQKYPNREEAKDAAFDRLLNIYNSDPPTLPPEDDQYLATHPTSERAHQAKRFTAQAL